MKIKLFFTILLFLVISNFFSKFVQWFLVAVFKFPVNNTTGTISLIISSVFLAILFGVLIQRIGISK